MNLGSIQFLGRRILHWVQPKNNPNISKSHAIEMPMADFDSSQNAYSKNKFVIFRWKRTSNRIIDDVVRQEKPFGLTSMSVFCEILWFLNFMVAFWYNHRV